MLLQESGEMYLETILVLNRHDAAVRAVDICDYMGFSKPSVSRALGLLKTGGYVAVSESGRVTLTELGQEIAEKIYERHTLLTRMLTDLGVEPQRAADDACRIEHVISEESFRAIKQHLNKKNDTKKTVP